MPILPLCPGGLKVAGGDVSVRPYASVMGGPPAARPALRHCLLDGRTGANDQLRAGEVDTVELG